MSTILKPENHLHTTESRWFAVYTRFKREKVVRDELIEKGIEVFLPIQKLLRQYGRKRKWVELPLFNSYVFVKITKKEYVPVLSTDGVVKFVRFSENLISIPELEIQLLKRIIGANIPIKVEESEFKEGEVVEIIAGNLAGMKGTLIEVQGKNKVSIELDHLGYTLKLEMPSSSLRRQVFMMEK
ncbi:MAG TPA: UpxY family transcription antiterminator [Saprospiraceae bacterium]|nr:UpxY family transcription antiterminator [Saprospiraceae bacterium]